MSDFAQYPYEALEAVGSNLSAISEKLGDNTRSAFEIIGLSADQDRIYSALGNFQREWEASVTKLGENIGSFGDTSTQIGVMAGQFDAEVARSMSPGGSRGRARGAGRAE
jgi:hypothetical protein